MSVNKYIIFQKDLNINNNEIVSWAPKILRKDLTVYLGGEKLKILKKMI